MHQQQTAFENIVGKGEIAHDEQFLHFQQCFLLNWIILSPFVHVFHVISLFDAEFYKPKIGISDKELRPYGRGESITDKAENGVLLYDCTAK